MQSEFGGYLPLEIFKSNEYFDRYEDIGILRLNCARNAIVVAARSVICDKLYIPYYICDVVWKALEKHGIRFERYFLDEKFI